MGVKVSIAVVNEEGQVVSISRMDGEISYSRHRAGKGRLRLMICERPIAFCPPFVCW